MNERSAPAGPSTPSRVRELARRLAADGGLPAMITDLAALRGRVAQIRSALPAEVELYYAAKANSEPPVLNALSAWVDGFEVASQGEVRHLREHVPQAPLAFGGPAKTPASLLAALDAGVELLHVESVSELRQLLALDRPADILLRANPVLADGGAGRTGLLEGAALVMGGRPSPFGLDPDELDTCARLLRASAEHTGQQTFQQTGEPGRVRFQGLHLHLASGLDAPAHLELCRAGLRWARDWAERAGLPVHRVNLGGGMSVDYARPACLFDWKLEGEGLALLAAEHPGVRLRLEPGRSVAAYAGWYATRVVDVRRSHGEWFAVVEGGTHHLRTPAARGHDQPFDVLQVEGPDDGPGGWPHPWPRPESGVGPLTVAGALCTPRDVLSRRAEGSQLRAGDVVLFGMAGAYGWNISHHEFLMHPEPSFHYLD